MKKYLILGLGNIGAAYVMTRHNIGFQVVDHLADLQKVDFEVDKLASWTVFSYKGRTIYLLKPTTLMNQSGKALHYWLHKLKIPVENSLTVVDDLALPVGKLRLKLQGGDGGHNGLASIETSLKTHIYARLRVGIGNNFARGQQANYVLSPFTQQENVAIEEAIALCGAGIMSFCTIGPSKTMEAVNQSS